MTNFRDLYEQYLYDTLSLQLMQGQVAHVSTPHRRSGKNRMYRDWYAEWAKRYSGGTVHDNFWHRARYVEVTLHKPQASPQGYCVCHGTNTPLGPLGIHRYMPQSKLPLWLQTKIMKLQMMEPYHEPISGIGQRRGEDEYRVLAPYTYLPRRERKR